MRQATSHQAMGLLTGGFWERRGETTSSGLRWGYWAMPPMSGLAQQSVLRQFRRCLGQTSLEIDLVQESVRLGERGQLLEVSGAECGSGIVLLTSIPSAHISEGLLLLHRLPPHTHTHTRHPGVPLFLQLSAFLPPCPPDHSLLEAGIWYQRIQAPNNLASVTSEPAASSPRASRRAWQRLNANTYRTAWHWSVILWNALCHSL